MEHELIRAADAALGVADPGEAAAALNGQAENVTVPVATSDMRRVFWRGLAWSKLDVLAQDKDPNSPRRALADIAITALSVLNSDRTIAPEDTEDWDEIVQAVGGLAQGGVIPADHLGAVLALRTVQVPNWQRLWGCGLPLSAEDVQSIREA